MRVLWTAASGMTAGVRRVDALANDVANLDTTGFKSEDTTFSELLAVRYAQGNQQVPPPGNTPPGISVGSGVRVSARISNWTQGPLRETGRKLDVAWEGEGFFAVSGPEGVLYTRDGSFHVDAAPGGPVRLVTADGRWVLGEDGLPIDLTGADLSTLTIRPDGRILASVAGEMMELGRLQRVVFDHPERLVKVGNNRFAAGTERPLTPLDNPARFGTLRQGYLEASNVDLVDVMTKLLTAERAYALSARAVQTADQMMGLANNIRG
ncbi:MAG: flagellar hook-basal body protein [Alicyclobacillaceae bacterium]|nr:flagellar hook-basal body protein [Alicyclobacillaceae bacterium]